MLVVDDAPEIVALVQGALEGEGFSVKVAEDGEGALELARSFDPQVVVLDVGLPSLDGIEVCRRLRTFSDAYVVMLTAKGEEIDRLVGLSVGADDYLTKPFSPRELVARIRAMLRRPRSSDAGAGTRKELGDLTLEVESREVTVAGTQVALTKIEFDLLAVLLSRPNVVFTRDMLLTRVWGENVYMDTHVVDVHMAELRRKLGDDPKDPRYVRTVRGVGYRCVESGT